MNIRRNLLIPAPKGGAIFPVETAYTSRTDNTLIQESSEMVANDTFGISSRRWSADGGRTWSAPVVISTPKEVPGGTERTGESALLFDEITNRVLRFYNLHVYPEETYTKDVARLTRICWEVSCDGGTTFSEPHPLIMEGGTPESWAPGVRYGINSTMISFSAPFVDRKGRVILPAHRIARVSAEIPTYSLPLEAGCFVGEWEGDRLAWRASETITIAPGLSSRGLFEPTIAQLPDGRFLMVCRGSNSGINQVPARKWISTSDDALHWSAATPFGYDDGSFFYSPSTGSRLIRCSRNSRLYWIGNITVENATGNIPRHPLQIAEVDEVRLTLKRESVHVLDERGKEESETLQLSNFRAYEDRETGELAVTLARLFADGSESYSAPATQIRFTP